VKTLDLNGKQDIGVARHGNTTNMDLIMTKTIDELLNENTEIKENQVDEAQANETNETIESVVSETENIVVELLKKSLDIHWQQTTSLSAQAVHLERWGYKKLAAVIKADALEEHQHAIINLTRLEFFDQDYQPLIVSPPSWTRHDMLSMINYNLASVKEAAAAEKATILAARAVGDELTANIMIPLLQGSEDGIELYEGYLKLIEQMGIDNFLTLQA
jgi:bacterioferritin (cytochrome b1)